MKEFIKALKCVLLSQLLCWAVFILCDENKFVSKTAAEYTAMIVGPILLIVVLVLYFVFKNKYITKNKLNSKIFNLFLFVIWIIFTILMGLILEYLVGKYLHVCTRTSVISWTCFLNGIEYFLYTILVFLFPILILIINLIIKLCKYIKRKLKK